MKAAEAASSKKAGDIVILEMTSLIGITDYFVICSGNTERQVGTIGEAVEKSLREDGVKPYRREGEHEKRWVLMDYLDVIVHIFHNEDREYYRLERLWKDAPRVAFKAEPEEEAG